MFGMMIDIGLCSTIPNPLHDLKVKVTDISFALKFLGPHYFQTLWFIWFMSCMMIDIGPKF